MAEVCGILGDHTMETLVVYSLYFTKVSISIIRKKKPPSEKGGFSRYKTRSQERF